jgi:hypothetical protein
MVVFLITHPNLLIQESAAFIQAYNTIEENVGDYIHYQTNLLFKMEHGNHTGDAKLIEM